MLPNAPVLHFSISGELPLPGSPVGSASFCTCLATETQSDSAARLRFNISPLGKWRLIFSPRSVFVFFFVFFRKGSGRGQISLMFFHVCVLRLVGIWAGLGHSGTQRGKTTQRVQNKRTLTLITCQLLLYQLARRPCWAMGGFVSSAMAESGIHVTRAPVELVTPGSTFAVKINPRFHPDWEETIFI